MSHARTHRENAAESGVRTTLLRHDISVSTLQGGAVNTAHFGTTPKNTEKL